MFVTFEGIGGAGKTTQAALLRDSLQRSGRRVVLTREPGGTEFGEQLRPFLLGSRLTPWCEAALFAASRAQLVHEVIGPALERGDTVICDRYLDSSLVYQGLVRGLGVDAVLELNRPGIMGCLPDRTFLLNLDADTAYRRRQKTDLIESQERGFRLRVIEAYGKISKLFPDRISVIDASRSIADVSAAIRDELYGVS